MVKSDGSLSHHRGMIAFVHPAAQRGSAVGHGGRVQYGTVVE